MSHPGVAIDPAAASAEFAAVAAVLGVPTETVGAGADPATAAALVGLGAAALAHNLLRSIATSDQTGAAAAGERTVSGYVSTEGQNEHALSRTETIAV